MKTKLTKLGSAAALTLGLSFNLSAIAAPVFTVDPTVIGNNSLEATFANQPFQTDFIGGSSSSLLTLTAPTTISGVGYIAFSGFDDLVNGGTLASTTSGLGLTYQLWAEYSYSATLVSGVFGQPLSVANITALSFDVWGSTNTNAGLGTTTFIAASTAGTGTTPVVNRGVTSQRIGFGSLLPGAGVGGAVLNAQGGSSFNAGASYTNTAFGNTFFTSPFPFYDIAFAQFNNTIQGVSSGFNANGQRITALNNATGGIDFNQVPEPAILALVSIGLIGAGAASRRRNSKVTSA